MACQSCIDAYARIQLVNPSAYVESLMSQISAYETRKLLRKLLGLACEHPDVRLVKYLIANGNYQIRSQCFYCNHKISGAHKRGSDWRDYPESIEPCDHYTMRYIYAGLSEWIGNGLWWYQYRNYLNSPAWQAMRQRVFERDNFRCVDCGQRAEQAHHLTYERVRHEELSDLISLCRDCHKRRHGL